LIPGIRHAGTDNDPASLAVIGRTDFAFVRRVFGALERAAV
jgi:hypothetical protein